MRTSQALISTDPWRDLINSLSIRELALDIYPTDGSSVFHIMWAPNYLRLLEYSMRCVVIYWCDVSTMLSTDRPQGGSTCPVFWPFQAQSYRRNDNRLPYALALPIKKVIGAGIEIEYTKYRFNAHTINRRLSGVHVLFRHSCRWVTTVPRCKGRRNFRYNASSVP